MIINFKVDNLKSMHDELKAFSDFLLDAGVCDDDIFASKLVTCELITNVIRHGGDTAFFTGALENGEIVITVSADSMRKADFAAQMPDVFAESGRGLYIVKNMCRGEIERGEDGEVRVYLKRK